MIDGNAYHHVSASGLNQLPVQPYPLDEPDLADALTQAQAELEHLAYAISHDLRGSVRRVQAYADLLQSPRDPAEGQELMHGLQQAAVELNRNMEAVLMYSRLGRVAPVMEKITLASLLEEVWQQVQPTLSHRQVRVSVSELPVLTTDRSLLRQLLLLLLDNALKATWKQPQPEICIQAQREGGGPFTLHLRDNGIGFDPVHASSMFRMFRRLHGAQDYPPGSGCGLAFARRICQRLGGSLHAQGTPGQGAHFTLTLPAPSVHE